MALPSNSLSPISVIDDQYKFVMTDAYQGYGVALPSTLINYLKSKISTSWSYQSYVPSNGNTLTLPQNAQNWATIKPLTALSTLDIILPQAQPGYKVRLTSSQIIATVTIRAYSNQFINNGNVQNLGAGSAVDFEFNGLDSTWYAIGV